VRTPVAWADLPCAWSGQVPRDAGAGLPLPWREPGLLPHVGILGAWAALPRAHSRTRASHSEI